MHLGRSGAIHCTCTPLGEQGLWGRVSWQRAQPCRGLEVRSTGEIPDIDGAGSGGVGSWGTQLNLDWSHGLCRKVLVWVMEKPGARPGLEAGC